MVNKCTAYCGLYFLLIGLSISLKFVPCEASDDYLDEYRGAEYNHGEKNLVSKYNRKYSKMTEKGRVRFMMKCLIYRLDDDENFDRKCGSHKTFIDPLASSIIEHVSTKAGEKPQTASLQNNTSHQYNYEADNTDYDLEQIESNDHYSVDSEYSSEQASIVETIQEGTKDKCLDSMIKIFPSIPPTSPMLNRLCMGIVRIVPTLVERINGTRSGTNTTDIFCETMMQELIDNIPKMVRNLFKKACSLINPVSTPSDETHSYHGRMQKVSGEDIRDKALDAITKRPTTKPIISTTIKDGPSRPIYIVEIAICNRLGLIMDALSLPNFIIAPIETVCQFIEQGVNSAINRRNKIKLIESEKSKIY